jgi:hypothetical protein
MLESRRLPEDLDEEHEMADPTTNSEDNPSEDNLRAEYGEVSSNIRWLADVRFKLLGLVPLATILGGWFFTSDTSAVNPLVSLFGLVITVALMIYNERNDQHYDELIGRAKKLEQALGLHEGQFSQRPGTWLTLVGVKVNHSTAVYLIYKASITVWVFGVLYPILDYGLRASMAGQSPPQDPPSAVSIALITAILSVLAVGAFFRILGLQKEGRKKEMRTAAKEAMGNIVGLPRKLTFDGAKWQEAFGYLAIVNFKILDKNKKERRREERKERQRKEEERRPLSLEVLKLKDYEDERKRWEAKATHYIIQEHANVAQPPFSKPSSAQWDVESAAYLAAHLTGLPARWYKEMYREYLIDLVARANAGKTEE